MDVSQFTPEQVAKVEEFIAPLGGEFSRLEGGNGHGRLDFFVGKSRPGMVGTVMAL
ncbi:hypothetical protein [Micromonospora foliorum]|uniref:hypothetical protein n=1 Tax=Micromonospora foliorum TaxID=2911210 RepID=UPI001EE7AB78|nr:hypothetical protein [Micromonospora foliorum]MCG5434581.1 hypothetical protein [Micromonospora foliorum]